MSMQLREKLGLEAGGVVVGRVDTGPLKKAGAKAGDVIISVNEFQIETAAFLNKILGNMTKEEEVTILLMRGDDILNLVIDGE